MMGWLLTTSPEASHLPPTYHTPWLWVHVGMGKVFLGAVLVALGISGVILWRSLPGRGTRFANLPDDVRLERLAFRFMVLGFLFESLMLVAGALWANDAWGRYWAWDPLETWAFATWLLLAAFLHARVTLRLAPPVGAAMVVAVFCLAFLTFFGVPFFSVGPHKGVI
jgi:ABC-type transport system involved in cytochrome c biogenesis permease subunit